MGFILGRKNTAEGDGVLGGWFLIEFFGGNFF